MNLLSMAGMSVAVAQVRLTEATMRGTVQGLIGPGGWQGADADRFQAEWESLVSARLLSAARRLESIDLNPFN